MRMEFSDGLIWYWYDLRDPKSPIPCTSVRTPVVEVSLKSG
jgi:hypothetical protein